MLGGKSLECFVFSGLYDSDEEFFRRYGEPSRAAWMLAHYATTPTATHAVARLRILSTQQPATP